MKFSLVVGQGPHKGRVIPVSLTQFLLGRDSGCHLRPASHTISKRHCELLVRDGKWFVRDLNSTNGTFVNADQVAEERELQDGDVLKVGPLDFGVRIEVEAQAERATEVARDTQASEAPATPPETARPDSLDEDSVGSMLLELTGAEQGAGTEDSSLEGSTIMDAVKGDDQAAPYRPTNQKDDSSVNTSSAAKEILEKYRRRAR